MAKRAGVQQKGGAAAAKKKATVKRTGEDDQPEKGEKEKARYSAPALEKGLDILEFLSGHARAYPLAQLACEIGRTKGEIFRMLVVLEDRGYVERDPETDEFQVTDKLLRIGLQKPKYRGLTEVARPLMEAFAEEMRYPCHLAIASNEQIVVIASVESPDLVGVTVRVGFRQPLLETGSGRCILSRTEGHSRDKLLEGFGSQLAESTLRELENEREAMRSKGYLIEKSRVMEGVWDISCPILRTDNNEVVAALSSPYVRLVINEIGQEAVADRLRGAAAKISRKFSSI